MALPPAYFKLDPLPKLVCRLLAMGDDDVAIGELGRVVKSALPLMAQQGIDVPEKMINRDVEAVTRKVIDAKLASFQSGNKYRINPEIADSIVQETFLDGRLPGIARLINADEKDRRTFTEDPRVRRAKVEFYTGDRVGYQHAIEHKRNYHYRADLHIRDLQVLSPFNEAVYEKLTDEMRTVYWTGMTPFLIAEAAIPPEAVHRFFEWHRTQPIGDPVAMSLAADVALAAGAIEHLRPIVELLGDQAPRLKAVGELLSGDWAASLKTAGKTSQSESPDEGSLFDLYQCLMRIAEQTPESTAKAKKIAAKISKQLASPYLRPAQSISLAAAYQARPVNGDVAKETLQKIQDSPLASLFCAHVWTLCFDHQTDPLVMKNLDAPAKRYDESGFRFLAAEIATLSRLSIAGDPLAKSDPSAKGYQSIGCQPFAGQNQPTAKWKATLDSMASLIQKPMKATAGAARQESARVGDERMVWLVEYSTQSGNIDVRPLIQLFGKKGWSKGRPVALLRLYDDWKSPDFKFLDAKDREICKTLQCVTSQDRYGYTDYSCFFESEQLLPCLIDHPRLFTEKDRDTPLEIVLEPPRLVVRRRDDGFAVVTLTPKPKRKSDTMVIVKESTHRLAVTQFDSRQQELLQLLQDDLIVPDSATDELMTTVSSLASIAPVHSDIAATAVDSADHQTIAPAPAIHAHLMPYEQGLQLQFFTRPLGDIGGFFTPGDGTETVVAAVGSETFATRRDLAAETQNLESISADCGFLADQNPHDVVYLPTIEDALEALTMIDHLVAEERLTLHWPKGKAFEIAGRADESKFQMNVKREGDWFAASGKLVVDDSLTLDMMELFNATMNAQSRFVQLNDGRFLALTDHFRRRLEAMSTYSNRSGGGVRFPPIRAAAIAEAAQGCDLQSDADWKSQLSRIDSADKIRPKVPQSFTGNLRDYQIEGFKWLSRLAHWGAGACLADDMGLGKTLQAIAVLIARSAQGPALVVAPTSVGFNWVSEIQKFAPTLRPILFSESERESVIEELGPRDVLICTYGLLSTQSELIQSVAWNTVVLDEAQAIKNADTRRSEAAMGLSADFRLVMTGTPMENHLGELWNLFQFINPGLLGSDAEFQARFRTPIERDKSPEARRNLKQLIRPFILRRTKSQVLDELPSRTEVTIHVELDKEHAAMYEALRQTALKNLADADDGRPAYIRILGELMRMRRFCCHPDLVVPDSGLDAPKITLFRENVQRLIDGGHKVLVFSQFVDQLHFLRAELDEMGVSYQYLDGSTPTKQRKSAVEAFQSGDGDVFLISLRAGGVGLNLTAADYVIHMDPWWNPAVEDQASDRAHRMGQKRPVTIYRFITEGTIEEKILDLHATKRDLADDLLEGTEGSAKLSTAELMKLIQA